jgi:hypothetical protein
VNRNETPIGIGVEPTGKRVRARKSGKQALLAWIQARVVKRNV